ncbi:MAG: Smr/MutS family protein, partial [Treponemataceae bacterium]|nr:Smr/MutS family protein [Treponemataceae bacterium]
NQADVSTLIQGLTEKYREASLLADKIKDKEEEVNEKWRKVDLKNLQVKQHELELREQGYRQSKAFVEESRRTLENLVRELKDGNLSHEKTVKVKQTLDDLTEKVESEASQLKIEKQNIKPKIEPLPEFAEGESVKIGSKKIEGIILKKEKKGTYLVQAGSIKLSIKAEDMTKTGNSVKDKAVSVEIITAPTDFSKGSASEREKPVFELRLLGMRYEEAVRTLEKQLDLCNINNFKSFSIIHGKGDGILQKAVWDYLKNYPFVESYNFASPEDGGSGKTYVTLR